MATSVTAAGEVRTFVKQYGLQRTGTNAVRALLEQYVPGVTVLMHVLGDKHSPPVDLRRVMDKVAGLPDPAVAFVAAATASAPSATTEIDHDPRQRAYVQAIASAVYRAARDGQIRVVVTVREPYDWVHALLRWQSTAGPRARRACGAGAWQHGPPHERHAPLVRTLCEAFNHCHAAWTQLVESSPQGALVVRHEQLAGDLDVLVAELVSGLRLPAEPLPRAQLPRTLGESHWDHDGTPVRDERNEARRQRVGNAPPLPVALREIVTASIDWSLAGRWGYGAGGLRDE